MFIRLYNQYGAANDVGNEISDKVATLLTEIINEYSLYDYNDLTSIFTETVGAEMAVAKVTRAARLRKAEKLERASVR